MKAKPLNANSIKQAISHSGIQGVHVFDVLDSSNEWALQHANCGDACLTEKQTAGRGRRGRVWHSPQQSNLYLSLKWCFDEIPKHFSLLSLVVGVVIAECLQKEGLQSHGLKWPNDILWQGKKLGGILLESKGNPCHIVIGIGLNIAMPQSPKIDQPWADLNDALNRKIDRNVLAGQLLSALTKRLQDFQQLNIEQFRQEWRTWDILQDQQVSVISGDKVIQGQAVGINPHGMLEVYLDDGSKQELSSAEVSIRLQNINN